MDADFATMGFDRDEFFSPPSTVSLADTNFVVPNSPDSLCSMKDEDEKRPTKKRKSWGQELPTPKTNLPPRKRAKTEDEKEQRRIERVLRNRQAAQSSRERKRQEVEKLEGEKHEIELQNQRLKERLMAVEHEKFMLAQLVNKLTDEVHAITGQNRKTPVSVDASCAPSPSLRAHCPNSQAIKQELKDYSFALPTPQKSIDHSLFSSRPSSSCSLSPSPSEIGLGSSAFNPPSDLTQHPAAMLCGLQCQSEAAWLASFPLAIRQHPRRAAFIHLLSLTLVSLVYSRLLHPLRLIFRSIRTGSPLPTPISPRATPMIFLLINWLISTPASPTPPTTTSSSTITTPPTRPHPPTTSSTPLPARPPIFRLRLLRRLLLCSLALARPRRDATSEAMRTQTDHALNGTSTDSLRGRDREGDGDGDGRGLGSVDSDEGAAAGRESGTRMTRAGKMMEKERKGGRGASKNCTKTRRKRS